jgi:colicin import membrane protein
MAAMTPPSDDLAPASGVELAPEGGFLPPPSQDSRRAITIGTVLAALLLHLLVAGLLLYGWRPAAAPAVHPIAVTLLRELPKPPPKPKPKPAATKPKPPQPPKPAALRPRESGPDRTTESIKTATPRPALPQAMPVHPEPPTQPPPEPLPQPPAPKPVPPRSTAARTAPGHGVVVPVDRLPAALRPQREAAPRVRNLTLRLPSRGGGGTRNLAGDAYLNGLMQRIERNRVYPPAEDFVGALSHRAIFDIVIDPSGTIVTITMIGPTGVPRLDEAAREMITDSEPFPRLPGDYPQIRTSITIFVPLFPR